MSSFESAPDNSEPYDQETKFGFETGEEAAAKILEMFEGLKTSRLFLSSEVPMPELYEAATWLRANGINVTILNDN